MVWVPPGTFLMGSKETGEEFADAKPVHQVRLTKGFWLGQGPVTIGQFKQFCQEAGNPPPDTDQGDTYPVLSSSDWTMAQQYCKHYGLSLPTEAQWEYAARGAEGRKWPWGNTWDAKKCCNADNPGPTSRDGSTWPVGSFPAGASWCGALDMAGNVWEWCQDWYLDTYYSTSPAQDPPGPAMGRERVRRGGSWVSDAENCRSDIRDHLDPANPGAGFRCAKTP
jgi:formylglycine-generating enzyme required for sulfatase activity